MNNKKVSPQKLLDRYVTDNRSSEKWLASNTLLETSAYGKVWEVYKSTTNTESYALNVVDLAILGTSKFKQAIKLQELAARKGLALPIVGFAVFADEQIGIYLTLRGENFYRYLLDNVLTYEECVIWLKRALTLARALHAIGIYHGNLRLENFIISGGKLYFVNFYRAGNLSMDKLEIGTSFSEVNSMLMVVRPNKTELIRRDIMSLDNDFAYVLANKFKVSDTSEIYR